MNNAVIFTILITTVSTILTISTSITNITMLITSPSLAHCPHGAQKMDGRVPESQLPPPTSTTFSSHNVSTRGTAQLPPVPGLLKPH